MSVPDQEASVLRLERHLAELQGLTRVLGQINRSLELGQILESTISGIQHVLGGGFGCFILIDPATHKLELAHPSQLPATVHDEIIKLARDFTVPPDAPFHLGLLRKIGDRLRDIVQSRGNDWVTYILLTAKGRPIGVLMIAIETGRLLMPPSVDMLMSIGEQVGMAIENARLHAAVRESEEWNRAFLDNSLDGCWEGDFSGRVTYVNDAACEIMEYTREELLGMAPAIFALDPSDAHAVSDQLRQQGFVAAHSADVRTKNGQIKSVSYSVRLVRDRDGKPARYQAVFRDITEQKRLVEMLRRRNDELGALSAIGSILNRPLETEYALDLVCDQIATLLGMESVAVCLVDEARTKMRLVAHHGVEEPLLSAVREVSLEDAAAHSIAIEGKIYAMDDLTTLPLPGFAGPREAGYHAGIAVPIRIRGHGAGAIFVGSKSRFRYEQSDVSLLGNIAERVGMALENAELYLQMQRRLKELDGLAQLSSALIASLDPADISKLAIEWTRRLLDADACRIRLIQSDLVCSSSSDGDYSIGDTASHAQVDESVISALRRGHPYVVEDLTKDPSIGSTQRSELGDSHIRSFLSLALHAPDGIIGMLTIGHTHPHIWLQNEIDLLKTIANESANAIHNAQLYQNVLSEQRKVQAIFDSGISGLFATDAQGRIVMFNRAAERITGWTGNEIQGKKWEEIFADLSSPGLEPLINEALIRKRTAYMPDGRKIRTRFGTTIPVAKAVAPLVDENDRVTGAVGAFWDLSREKEAEMDYARFLSEVAHQLRNPLTTVISGLELLEKPRISSKNKAETRSLVRSQAERLKTFSQQFLEHQKAVYSPQPVECEELCLYEIVDHVVAQFRITFPRYSFQLHCADDTLKVSADRFCADNILRNLLDNAVTYSPEGSTVTISIGCVENGSKVDVAVQDRGYGIPLSQQEHIFEPFYRASHTTERRQYGHGLGLFIARQMARQMGAAIEFESQENEGSTFHLILRRVS